MADTEHTEGRAVAGGTGSTAARVGDRILAWAEALPAWQSDLLRRLCDQDEPTGMDVEEVGRLLLADHDALEQSAARPPAQPLERHHLPTPMTGVETPILVE